MPRLSVWLVRTALIQLVVAALLGGTILTGKVLAPLAATAVLRPLHIELATLGWIANLGIGVAYWILPRRAGGPARGDPRLAVAAGLSLNLGLLAAGLAPVFHQHAVAAGGHLLETAAALLFALHAWPRVRRAAVITTERRESA